MFQDFTNDQEVKSQRKRSHSRESKSYDGDLSNYHVTDSVLADLETDTEVDVKPLGRKQHTFTWLCLLWP